MSKNLRRQILAKLAQTTPAQPEQIAPALAPPPAVPSDVFTYLHQGFNTNTAGLLASIISQLNIALHYASQGKDSIQRLANNNMDLSGASSEHKNIGAISKKIFDTFFNKKNPFPKKVPSHTIQQWSDVVLTMPEYNSLSQIKPTSLLASKLQGDLKNIILTHLNQIKSQNPVSQ